MRRREHGAVLCVALAALAALPGCTRIEMALGRIPFLAYMREAPFFDPYEAPRPSPAGAVPFRSPMGEVLAPIQPAETALRAFAAGPAGTNPFTADSAFRALGRRMYDRHCMVCHGTAGLGDGPIVQRDPSEQKYLPGLARNLTLPAAVALPDGYIYGVIWVGRGLMPPYGSRMTHRERWAVVQYVRELQAAAATGAPGGAGN